MTSRERVRLALAHQEADRVPLDISGTLWTGIHMDEYCELAKAYSPASLPPRVFEQFQMLARVDASMQDWLQGDVAIVENPVMTWGLHNEDWKPWQTFRGNTVLMPGGYAPVDGGDGFLYLRDERGQNLAMMNKGGLYFERCCPVHMRDDFEPMDVKAFGASLPVYTDEELAFIRREAKALYDSTELSVFGACNRGQLSTYGLYANCTITDWLVLLMTEPEYTFDILATHAEKAVENFRLYLQAAGDYCDAVAVSGMDYGIQTSELFRPDIFRDQYMPNMKTINGFIHSHSKCKTFYHSCGSIRHILPYMIEGGVDIINPVQTSAAGMEPEQLKAEFGDKLVFWGGGADTQHVLPDCTPEEVYAHVRERIRTFAPGGGFVFSPVHNLQYGVPPQNVAAMLRSLRDNGGYPVA
jgi:uroporphyrinogen decarboxylase